MKIQEKRTFLFFLFLISSFFFTFLTKYFFWQGSFKTSLFILWIFSFVFLLFSFSSFALGVPLNVCLLALLLNAFLLCFLTKLTIFGVIFAILNFLFSLWSYFSFQKAKNLFLKIIFFEILKKGMPPFILSLSLTASLFLFLSPSIFGGKLTLSEKLFNLFFSLVSKPLSNFFGGDLNKMTVDEFLEGVIKIHFKEVLSIPSTKEIILKEKRESLSEIFGTKLQGGEQFREVIYLFFQKKISETTSGFQKFGTIGILLFLFIAFRTIFTLFSLFVLPILVFFFIILTKNSFFVIEKTQKEIEKLKL